MKFGVMQLVGGGFGRTEPEAFEQSLEVVRLAEELGFDSVWFGEHHFTDYGLVGNTLQMLTAAAMVTDRIRLGAAVVVAPLHNPLRIAEEAAIVDVLSGGRLDLGIGRGYQPSEFASFGLDMAESRARAEEAIAFLERAWTADGPFEWPGQFFNAPEVRSQPAPIQSPHPPLWHAAVSAESFDLAGAAGRQVLTSPNFTPLKMVKDNFDRYTKALEDNGHDPKSFAFPIMQHVYIGEDDDKAYEIPREPCMSFFSKLGSLLPSDVKSGDGSGESYASFEKTKRKIADLQYEYLYEQSVTFGSPQRAVDRIKLLKEELNIDYLMGTFNFGSLPHEEALASMRRFAEQVMPAVQALEPSLA